MNIGIKKNKVLYKYSLFYFLFLLGYNFIFINRFNFFKIDSVTYALHLVDFSFGFCTKFLPGVIYHLFFKDVIPWQVTVYETVLLLLVYAFFSFVLAKTLITFNDKYKKRTFFVLSMFFLTGPSTFSMFSDELGMSDVYWVYAFVLLFLFIENKYFKYLLPLVFIFALLNHYAALTSYIPAFFLIFLYRICIEKNKKLQVSYSVLFTITLIIIGGLTVYFFLYEKSNVAYNLEQFNAELYNRARFGLKPDCTFYDMTFFDYSPDIPEYSENTDWLITNEQIAKLDGLPYVLRGIITVFIGRINMASYFYVNLGKAVMTLVYLVLLFIPVMVLFFKFWVYKIKNSNQLIEKMVFVFMIFIIFSIIPIYILCVDVARWTTNWFLSQCLTILFVIYKENDSIAFFVSWYKKCNKSFLMVYFIIYSLSYFFPYY